MDDKKQEEFEAWFAATYPLNNLERTCEEVLRKEIARQAWFASRSIGVELPEGEWLGDSWSGGWAIIRETLVDKLEEQGFKVKTDGN